MNTCHAAPRPLPGAEGWKARELLSLREVVMLADVPEKRVRKDIETGLLTEPRIRRLSDARLCFAWYDVFVVAAVYGNCRLNGALRKLLVDKLNHVVRDYKELDYWHSPTRFLCESKTFSERCILDFDKYISVNLHKVCHNVQPRVGIYAYGLARIEEKDDVLGGDAVFKGTRLPVSHIGKMRFDGEKMENMLEDFPALNEDDVRFAELYHRAHPPIGRPRLRGGCDDAVSCS